MKVEIVSIGNALLMSDVLDTSAAHVIRSLREVKLDVTCRVTVGDDLELLQDVLRVALRRADVVLVIGDNGQAAPGLAHQAVSRLAGRDVDMVHYLMQRALAGETAVPGLRIEPLNGYAICLPGERTSLAYLLETRVLPYLRQRLQAEDDVHLPSGWILLRAVGVMESSIKQQLAGLTGHRSRITVDSFAGQTNIRLWTEAPTTKEVETALADLRQIVLQQLGDHIYGEGKDRLEDVVVQMLQRSHIRVAVAECFTHRSMARALGELPGAAAHLSLAPVESGDDLAAYLHIEPWRSQGDLSRWCRLAANELLHRTDVHLGLVVYNNISPGGIQVLVTLASMHGVSVTQRSFGGHPDSIDHWALTLALAHLRRWMLVHT